MELDATGVLALTTKLAEVAVRKLRADKSNVEGLARELLRTLIHKWQPKSYGFTLMTEPDGDEKPERIFRGHVYFGHGKVRQDGTRVGGPDSFPHINCFPGGSESARQFLIEFILREDA